MNSTSASHILSKRQSSYRYSEYSSGRMATKEPHIVDILAFILLLKFETIVNGTFPHLNASRVPTYEFTGAEWPVAGEFGLTETKTISFRQIVGVDGHRSIREIYVPNAIFTELEAQLNGCWVWLKYVMITSIEAFFHTIFSNIYSTNALRKKRASTAYF